MRRKQLNNRGIAHLFALIAVVLVTAVAGTYLLVSSKAATPETGNVQGEVTATASINPGQRIQCPSNEPVAINANQKDIMSKGAKYKGARANLHDARISAAIQCVKKAKGREVLPNGVPNSRTITSAITCPSGRVFAWDYNNASGSGYDESPWMVKTQSFNGNKKYGANVTLYCIQKNKVNNGGDDTGILGHIYEWKPMGDFYKGCPAQEKRYTACKKNWFFTYYGHQDSFHVGQTYQR